MMNSKTNDSSPTYDIDRWYHSSGRVVAVAGLALAYGVFMSWLTIQLARPYLTRN